MNDTELTETERDNLTAAWFSGNEDDMHALVWAIVAARVADARADAWDEGLNVGIALAQRGYASPNPYRPVNLED